MRYASIAAFVLLFVTPAVAQRLPAGVSPTHYTLWFAPDLDKASFRGRETITVTLDKPSTTITMHAAEITFGEVRIEDARGTQLATVSLNEKDETATFTVARAVARGTATVHVTYTGVLNDKLRGFYLSKANGRSYAVSQMEATDARRAFPSFDEPAYKATFDVVLMIDAGDTAISNGRQVSDTPGPEAGKHTVVFARTPKMSSYLVALLVGDFVCRSGAAASTPIRVCATPDKVALTAFALAAAEQEVAFFNKYFGIPYPYEKLDIIGVPDFAAGAMENAGAITFRERMLLANEATASAGVLKSVASVISHELAHQWFGDLVTMKWWDDIWLNEGFATWAANKPLAAWKPDWRLDVNAATETQIALGLDALQTTRAIRTEVSTPAEINEVFDPIAYEKTAGVLGMIEAYVGPEPFRRGVSSYLAKYAEGNAAGEDFWTEMTRVTEKPVNRIMKSFVEQAGAPLLTVKTRCVGGATEVSIVQSRFTGTPGAKPNAAQHWTLPVCIKTAANAASCTIVTEQSQTVRAPGCGTPVINADGHGYYFTEYEPAAVAALAHRDPPLTAPERISLLGDEWRIVRAGHHDIDTYLDLVTAMAGDPTPQVAAEIAGRIGFVRSSIADDNQRPRFDAWVARVFRPAIDRIGIDPKPGDSDDVNALRGTLIQLLSSDGEVQQHARTLALRYLAESSSVPPTLVSPVLQVAAAGGDAALYDRYLARMQASMATPEEYYRFFNALAAFPDPALRDRTLGFALKDARSQDTPLLLGQLLGTDSNRAWTFIKANWPALMDKLGSFQAIPFVVSSIGGCSADTSADLKKFFDDHPIPEAARGLAQAHERIAACVAVKERQSAAFAKWLSRPGPAQ
ncbi:MAG TPA: M1 family aminopeptidase [Vicinamibacterales bacterium]|nr:M1 family aminopeptidase [Vicinamibacterales bacterium]